VTFLQQLNLGSRQHIFPDSRDSLSVSIPEFLLLLYQHGWHVGRSGGKPLENCCGLTVSGTVEDSGAFLKRFFEPNPVVPGHGCILD
jgi:hypothetical protein